MTKKRVEKKAKSTYMINPEGAKVFKENIYRRFLLQGLTLNPGKNSFYFNKDEKVKYFIDTIDEISAKDKEFFLKSIMFLSDNGRKLSPVVGVTRGVFNGSIDPELLSQIGEVVFDNHRPDKIANAMRLYAMMGESDTIKKVSPFFKKHLKRQFEQFSELTLKKFKMKRRDITLADLIKILHPKPKDKKMSAFYKAIIENSKKASLKKEESITAMLSDADTTQEKKVKFIKDNIKTLPINAFIRNLKQLSGKVDAETKQNIIYRLNDIIRDKSSYKYFNIYDLLIPTIDDSDINSMLNEVIDNYIDFVGNIFSKDDDFAILLDISGSMEGDGYHTALKHICFLTRFMEKAGIDYANKVYLYDTGLYDITDSRTNKFVTTIKNLKVVDKFKSAYSLKMDFGGTNTIDTLKQLKKKEKNIILITDEMTHDDKSKIQSMKNIFTGTERLVVITTEMVDGSCILDNENLMRVAGFYSSFFMLLSIFSNVDTMVNYIKNQYKIVGINKAKVTGKVKIAIPKSKLKLAGLNVPVAVPVKADKNHKSKPKKIKVVGMDTIISDSSKKLK